jgi:hypothetical protein
VRRFRLPPLAREYTPAEEAAIERVRALHAELSPEEFGRVARETFDALSRAEQLEAVREVLSWGDDLEGVARFVGWSPDALRRLLGERRAS